MVRGVVSDATPRSPGADYCFTLAPLSLSLFFSLSSMLSLFMAFLPLFFSLSLCFCAALRDDDDDDDDDDDAAQFSQVQSLSSSDVRTLAY